MLFPSNHPIILRGNDFSLVVLDNFWHSYLFPVVSLRTWQTFRVSWARAAFSSAVMALPTSVEDQVVTSILFAYECFWLLLQGWSKERVLAEIQCCCFALVFPRNFPSVADIIVVNDLHLSSRLNESQSGAS